MRAAILLCLTSMAAVAGTGAGPADQPGEQVQFEGISQYNHIRVSDQGGMRLLTFNGSWQSQMSLADPMRGQFEYTEYFQMPFIWNARIRRVLMAGLGGGSTQRAFQHYYPEAQVDTVEIDPMVVSVAEKYFHVMESTNLRLHTNDARQFLRRTTNTYDVILMDAYTGGRYGAAIPPHLVTREFFELANRRLGTNGVLGYNVIGQIKSGDDEMIASMYRTLKEVFPQVYLFPVEESANVVFIATKDARRWDYWQVQRAGWARIEAGVVKSPSFWVRMKEFTGEPPAASAAIVLTDDYCPIGRLMGNKP